MCSISAQLAVHVKGHVCIRYMSMRLAAFFPFHHVCSFGSISFPSVTLLLSISLLLRCIYDVRLVVNANWNFSNKACFNPFFFISVVKWTAKRYWWINSWFCQFLSLSFASPRPPSIPFIVCTIIVHLAHYVYYTEYSRRKKGSLFFRQNSN